MFKSILLPIDLNAEASWDRAAPAAFKLSTDSGGIPLHVLSVLPDFGASMVGSYFEDGYEEKMTREAGEAMNDWVAKHVPTGVDVHPHIVHGRVYDQILVAADKLECDVIVMGSHRPELSDYLMGPNAASVVRHAKQSVFVIRPEG